MNHLNEADQGLLTPADVALHLGVSVATVSRLASAGKLRRIRIGGSTRYAIVDVEALISHSTTGVAK